jgi:hypothetical protein
MLNPSVFCHSHRQAKRPVSAASRRRRELLLAGACGLILCGATASAQRARTLDDLLNDGRGAASPPLAAPAAERAPIPTAAELESACELIRQAFEDYYADVAKSPRRLIDKLLEVADSGTDSTRRYALLVEAERVAVEAGELDAAVEAASLRSTKFAVDPAESRLQVLLAVSRSSRRDDERLVGMCLDLADGALAAGQIEVADRAATEAVATAKRVERRERQTAAEERKRTGRAAAPVGKAAGYLEQAAQKQRQVKSRRQAAASYEAALEALRLKPEDQPANGVVGRYLCFTAGNWKEGLPALAKSDADLLREAAAEEIKLGTDGASGVGQVLAVAGAWWKISESGGLDSSESVAAKQHAAKLYEQALPGIDDPIERTLASKRIAAAKGDGAASGQTGNDAPADRQSVTRRGTMLRVPASALLPAPAELSREIVGLLPTEAEVAVLQNHVNLPDRRVEEAKNAFLNRIYQVFSVERWTTVDAAYLIGLVDRLGEITGSASTPLPNGGWISGSREGCRAALAEKWLLTSKSEQEFAARVRSMPAGLLGRIEWMMSWRDTKNWLMSLGGEYEVTRRKLQAIDYLMQQGCATQGMLRYREDLVRTAAGNEP